jgi:hypothetical protein
VRKLLSSVVAYVVKFIGPLDTHTCLSWWAVSSLVVFCAACLVPESCSMRIREGVGGMSSLLLCFVLRVLFSNLVLDSRMGYTAQNTTRKKTTQQLKKHMRIERTYTFNNISNNRRHQFPRKKKKNT